MSFDVVPAFDKGHHYEIPDTKTKTGWTETWGPICLLQAERTLNTQSDFLHI